MLYTPPHLEISIPIQSIHPLIAPRCYIRLWRVIALIKPELFFESKKRKEMAAFEERFICYCLSHLNFRSFLFNLKYFQKIATTLIAVFRAKPVSFQKCLWKQEWMPKDRNVKIKGEIRETQNESLAFNFCMSPHSLFLLFEQGFVFKWQKSYYQYFLYQGSLNMIKVLQKVWQLPGFGQYGQKAEIHSFVC